MKRAPAVAASVAIVAAIAAVAVRWGGGRGDIGPASDERRGPVATSGGDAAAAPPESAAAPKPATPDAAAAPEGARTAETAGGGGERSVEFDLRGPDDEPLARGVVTFESDRAKGEASARSVQRVWRRESPRLALPAWNAWIHAEADSSDDDVVNDDLVSDPEAFEAAAPLERGGSPKLLHLHRRPGIFGKVSDVADGSSWMVTWRARPVGDERPYDGDEVSWNGRGVPVMRRNGVASYSIVDLEPGRYLLAVVVDEDGGSVPGVAVEAEVADRMVRVDLAAHVDASASLLVHLLGLGEEDAARAEFEWVDGAAPAGGWTALRRESAGDAAWRVTPIGPAARATMRRLLAGQLEARERCALALVRDGQVVAAQPLENGQHEATFTIDADANLTVRLEPGADRSPRRRIDVVPVTGLALPAGPPAGREGEGADGATVTRAFRRLAPGEFLLQVWAPLKSALHHGEVWWPIERRIVTLHAGDQEVVVAAPALHPLTVRFDPARFGAGAEVQLTLHGCGNQPRYAAPDERGVARFDDVPAGDYTVSVLGDGSGLADCSIPATSDLTVEPTRRER